MAIPNYVDIDYLNVARDQITEQFKNKQVLDKYLDLIIHQQYAISQVFKDLLQKRSIDEATGAQLDIIGEIVGQPRELINADQFEWFGFQGALKAGSFGTLDNPATGARFWDINTPQAGNITLDDETYRLFIKAKIIKNTTAATPEEFIAFVNYVFGTDQTYITEGIAEFTVYFGRPLTDVETVLLNYVSYSQGYPSRFIPKPVGVRVNFGIFQQDNYFGFQGAPGAKGFGDFVGTFGYGLGYGISYGDSDWAPGNGGVFAQII